MLTSLWSDESLKRIAFCRAYLAEPENNIYVIYCFTIFYSRILPGALQKHLKYIFIYHLKDLDLYKVIKCFMQLKIAKHFCFLSAIFLLIFIVFNSCKKAKKDANETGIPPADTTNIPNDTPHTEFMNVTAVLLDSAGNPLSGLFYTIIPTAIPKDFLLPYFPEAGNWTDSMGNLNTVALTNTDNILKVFPRSDCSATIFAKSFHTLNTDINLGNLIIPPDPISIIITGTVTGCNNDATKTGRVIIEEDIENVPAQNRKQYLASLKPEGTFRFLLRACNKTEPVPVIIHAEDASGLQMGNRVYFSLNYPENNIGKITACDNADTTQFIRYTFDSTDHTYYFPDNPNNHPENPRWTFLTAGNPRAGETQIYFGIDGFLAVAKPGLSLVEFGIGLEYDLSAETPPVVVITEDGPIGGYIAGNIKLKIETLDDSHSVHDATCSFRVKRKQ